MALQRDMLRHERSIRELSGAVRGGDRTQEAPIQAPPLSVTEEEPSATPTPPTPPPLHVMAPPPAPSWPREEERHVPPLPSGSESTLSLEKFLGERVFLVVGIIVALFALGWFLKVAIDRDWIGPSTRVGIGYAAGVAAFVAGMKLRTRGWSLFGQGLMGGGLGAFYLSTFFACVRYDFINRPTTFGAVVVLTAAAALVAIRRDAPLLAYLGFLGGFLAPAVLTTGDNRVLELTAWLGILNLGIIVVAVKRPWQGLDLLAVIFSVFYFVAWSNERGIVDRTADGSIALCNLVVLALCVPLLPAILRREPPQGTALLACFGAGLLAVVGGGSLLYPEHRRELGAGLAALAAVYFLGAHLLLLRCAARAAANALQSFGILAILIAVPVAFEGRSVAPVWSAVGLGLIVLGSRSAAGPLLAGGTALLGIAAAESVFGGHWAHQAGMENVFNAAFGCAIGPGAALVVASLILHKCGSVKPLSVGAHLISGCWIMAVAVGYEAGHMSGDGRGLGLNPEAPVGAFAASCFLFVVVAFIRRAPEMLRTCMLLPMFVAFVIAGLHFAEGDGKDFTPIMHPAFLFSLGTVAVALAAGALSPAACGRCLHVAALVFLFVLGTEEIFQWGRECPLDGFTRLEAMFRAQVMASVAWAVYAAALLGLGFLLRKPEFRWCAIILFGVTLLKVVFNDTVNLEPVYRILTYGSLGVLLVGASFLYQKRRAA